jgi:hypothetical protein
MANHGSNGGPLRYIAYSVATMTALAEGKDAAQARARAMADHGVDADLLVVAAVTKRDALHHLDFLPRNAEIVWRGSSELAQQFDR